MRPLPDRTLVLADLTVDPDGRVRFPVFDGEEDVPCGFPTVAWGCLADRAGYFVDPRDPVAVRMALALFPEAVVVSFGWHGRVAEVVDVVTA